MRRVEPTSVTVWLALKAACTVNLEVLDVAGGPFTGSRETIRLANGVHVVAVTARGTTPLLRGTVYRYNVSFTGTGVSGDLTTAGNLRKGTIGPATLSYEASGLPSFSLPPTSLDTFRLIHASCRKPHGFSRDTTHAIDGVIGANVGNANNRPHMLLLTGDQIYADDVANALLRMILDASTALGFPNETVEPLPEGTTELPGPGNRAEFSEIIGLTSGAAESHLVTFAEFATMYLFAWSDVLWQNDLPTYEQTFLEPPVPRMTQGGPEKSLKEDTFDCQSVALTVFRDSLIAMRRVLANVPVYMSFDDHEITDDWFLDRAWVQDSQNVGEKQNAKQAATRAVFKRLVQNGLSAYALFQAWGNDPAQYEPAEPGGVLLETLEDWAASPGDGTPVAQNLHNQLGLPTAMPPSKGPFPRHASAVNWHFTYSDAGFPLKLIFLDTRTHRAYGPGMHDRPEIIAPGDAPGELSNQLSLLANLGVASGDPVLVVSPVPVVGHPLVEALQGFVANFSAYGSDPEAWTGSPVALERFITALATTRPAADPARRRIVLLSGDVHYAYTARLRFVATTPFGASAPMAADAVFAQLTGSSLKNQDCKTKGLHWAHDTFLSAPGFRVYGWNNTGGGSIPLGTRPIDEGDRVIRREGSPIIYEVPSDFTKTATPEWRTAVTFVRSDLDREVPAPPPVEAVPSDPDGEIHAYLDTLAAVQICQEEVSCGTVVVGCNNVGELKFQWGAGEEKFVTHQLLWFQTDDVEPSLLSRFQVKLSLAAEDF